MTLAAFDVPPPAGSDDEPSVDPYDIRRAAGVAGMLRGFNQAGVLDVADIHVALRLCRLGADEDDTVRLGAALAVRAPRLGHVCVDLSAVAETVTADVEVPVDLRTLPWPALPAWLGRLAASPLVAVGEDDDAFRPLRLVETRLYLDRYWREEREVAAELTARGGAVPGVDTVRLADGLARLFPGPGPDRQRLAAATAVLRRLAVVAGGPGTGKTTTVARILALLDEQAERQGTRLPRVALAAPTGKAAARLEEAVHAQAGALDVDEAVRVRLAGVSASTLHRLLGWRPGTSSRFRHDRRHRLPHDVVVVDETSMVSLSMMASLVDALRHDARLVLVGDPQQLASVEAGAVLGDIVGPATVDLVMRPESRDRLAAVARESVPADPPPAGVVVGDSIVALRTVHRFGGAIAALADATRRGDADEVQRVLRSGDPAVRWIDLDVATAPRSVASAALAPLRHAALESARVVVEAARAGDGRAALAGLGAFRLLCAHRRGPYGASTWMATVEGWLLDGIDGFSADGTWYLGRPLLVTENDYGLQLFNGDTGVVVAGSAGRPAAVFARADGLVELSPTRLGAVDTVYAMTVHKSQGSQFDEVAVVLPDPASPILTRELLYTALTRARSRLLLVATAEALRAGVERPIARASGLRRRLWGDA